MKFSFFQCSFKVMKSTVRLAASPNIKLLRHRDNFVNLYITHNDGGIHLRDLFSTESGIGQNFSLALLNYALSKMYHT